MDQIQKKLKPNPQSRVIITLEDPYDVSLTTTKVELQAILNQLLKSDEELIYSFFHQSYELANDLEQLTANIPDYNPEKSFTITYHPQSLFLIKPLTRQTASLEGHNQPILTVQFQSTGNLVATGSGDSTIIIWDILTETPLHTLSKGHTNWVLTCAWSPDSKYLITGGMDGNVCLWDPLNGKQLGLTYKGHSKWITSVAWEPFHLNPECSLFASSSKDGTVRIWSRSSSNSQIIIAAHQKCITKMLWGGEGLIYTASEDTNIGVFNKKGQRVKILKGHSHWVNSIALHTDFILRTACFSEEKQEFSSVEEMKEVAKKRYDKILGGQSERLISGSDDQTLCLWTHNSAKPIKRLTGHQQQINHVQYSPDGRYIVSASFDKSLRIWDGYNGDFICVLRGHVGPVYQVSWSSDSRLMVSASKDSTVKLWSLSKRKLLIDLPGHADEVYAIDWAPIGGEKAVSGGKDRRVKIWRH